MADSSSSSSISSPRHLVVDARYVRPGRTGVGISALETVRALAAAAPGAGWRVTALVLPEPAGDPDALASTPNLTLLSDRIPDYERHPAGDLWLHGPTGLRRTLCRLRADAFYTPAFYAPFFPPCPVVATIPDCIAWRVPETYPPKFRALVRLATRITASRATRVIAISSSVREDLTQLLRADPARLRVVYPGVADAFQPAAPETLAAARAAAHIPRGPYFVWLSAIERRKDLPTALAAFENVVERCIAAAMPPPRLVIVGRTAPGAEDHAQRLRTSAAVDLIDWQQHFDRNRLPVLLSGARALLFPSRYEGFGLPAAEAIACATPVIAARAGALPEVVGEAGILHTPGDTDALAAAMLRLLEDETHLDLLRTKARARAHTFAWSRTARELLAIFDELVPAPPRP